MQQWLYRQVSRTEREVFFHVLLDYTLTPEREKIDGEIVDFRDGDCLYAPAEIAEEIGEKRTTVLTALQRLEEKGLISRRAKLRDKEGRWTCFIVDWEILFTKKGMWGWQKVKGGGMENVPEPKWAAQFAEEEARSKKSGPAKDAGDQAPPAAGSPGGGGAPPGGSPPGGDGPDDDRQGARKAIAARSTDGNNEDIIESFSLWGLEGRNRAGRCFDRPPDGL